MRSPLESEMGIFSSRWPSVDHSEVIRRSRLLAIDDHDFPYLELFRRDGYAIEKWDDVDDLPAIEDGKFDLILLDLLGVGKALSNDQGLGVLRYLRENFPAIVTIAYSGAEFRLEYQDFIAHADAALDKSSDYLVFKETVDHLLASRVELEFYIKRAASITGLSISSTPALRKQLRRAITGRDVEAERRKLRSVLERRVDQDQIDRTIQLCQLGANALQFFVG